MRIVASVTSCGSVSSLEEDRQPRLSDAPAQPLRLESIQALAEWPLDPIEQNSLFRAALSYMTQGLCMFDEEMRLVLCNDAYARMYDLRPEDTRPGTPLKTILERRVAAGSSPVGEVDYVESRLSAAGTRNVTWQVVDELQNGRFVSVTHRSLPSGGSVATHEDITERRKAEEHIAFMAHHDVLTGLANRVQFRRRLEDALDGLEAGASFALLYLDLDNFKTVNDTLGHPIGDALLAQVAGRIKTCLGPRDSAARLGGDEFAIIQMGAEREGDTGELARRIVEVIAQPFRIEAYDLAVGVSVGIALAPRHGADPDQLLRKADIALYRAKWSGRGTLRFFETGMEPNLSSLDRCRRAS